MSAEANPALQQLGRRLAQARQACGLSLEEQADRLNMGREQLQALEAGDRDLLPEAVFVIAQARRVANSLGIEINAEIEALRCSDGFRPQRPLRQASLGSPSEPTAGRVERAQAGPARRSGTGRSALLALTALLGAAAAVALVIRQGLPRLTTGQAAPPPPPVTSAEGTRTAADTAAELVLQSAEPSWLEVRSADGRTLFRGTLDAEQRFPLDGEIAVLAGRPDLVMVSIGRSEPTPMGSIQEVRWRRFRAEQAPPP